MTTTTEIAAAGVSGASGASGLDRQEFDGLLSPRAEAVLETIRSRRSHPHVLPEAPPRSTIEALLGLANLAPNHHLTQPWRFFVLTGDARLRMGRAVADGVAQLTPIADAEKDEARRAAMAQRFLRAPVVIAVAAVPVEPHIPFWEEIACTSAAIQNLLLAAHALGLAAFWRSSGTGVATSREFLGLPDDAQMVGFVYLGYPDPAAPALPPKQRRAHAEYVRWLD